MADEVRVRPPKRQENFMQKHQLIRNKCIFNYISFETIV